MKTIFLADFFGFLFTIIFFFFIIGYLLRLFMPFLIKWGLKKMQKRFERDFAGGNFNAEEFFNGNFNRNNKKRNENNIEFDVNSSSKDKNNQKDKKIVGEYIDFEEIK